MKKTFEMFCHVRLEKRNCETCFLAFVHSRGLYKTSLVKGQRQRPLVCC